MKVLRDEDRVGEEQVLGAVVGGTETAVRVICGVSSLLDIFGVQTEMMCVCTH